VRRESYYYSRFVFCSSATTAFTAKRVASASVRDGVSAQAVVFGPDYCSEENNQIRSHICGRDCGVSISLGSLAPAA
jgi:hypothetical protein